MPAAPLPHFKMFHVEQLQAAWPVGLIGPNKKVHMWWFRAATVRERVRVWLSRPRLSTQAGVPMPHRLLTRAALNEKVHTCIRTSAARGALRRNSDLRRDVLPTLAKTW